MLGNSLALVIPNTLARGTYADVDVRDLAEGVRKSRLRLRAISSPFYYRHVCMGKAAEE